MAKGRSNELSSFMQSLDVELMCGICLELFESPVMLPCSHNFCRKCLLNLIEKGQSFSFISIGPPTSFNCPICQRDFNMSNSGIDNLPVNKTLESIIAMYQKFSPIDIFDLAWNSDLSTDISTCPDHKRPMNKFCESCSIAVCKSCVKESHQSRHRVTSLMDIALTLQADIADTLTELKRKAIPVYERIETLDDMARAIDKEEEEIKRCLTHHTESLKSAIRAKHEELSEIVHSTMYEPTISINNQLKRCKMYRTQIQEMMKKLSAIRKTKHVNHRIKLMKDNILQLNIMLQEDFDWSAEENKIPLYEAPDLILDTQEVMATIAGLQWTHKDREKKTSCSQCTQTDSVQVQTHQDTPPPNNAKHVTAAVDLTNTTPTDKTDTDIAAASTDACKGIATDTARDVHASADNNNKENDIEKETSGALPTNTRIRSHKSKSDKPRSNERSDRSVPKSDSKQEIDILAADVETNSSNDMSKPSASDQSVKSTSRRSFPFAKHEDTNTNSTTACRVGKLKVVNGKTPPKDHTSEALASFFRRRTLSPFPPDKSRPRVSTSPLTNGNEEVVMETRTGCRVTKETNMTDNTQKRALSSKNFSKEPISVKLDFETDI